MIYTINRTERVMIMEKHGATPQGYLTVGEAANKMGVTVRTLQYYERAISEFMTGKVCLPPSAQSEGGRRLYTDKDLIKLHQILSLNRLAFLCAILNSALYRLKHLLKSRMRLRSRQRLYAKK